MTAEEFTITKIWYDEEQKHLMGEFTDEEKTWQGVIQCAGVENRLGNAFTEECLRKAAANFPQLPTISTRALLKQTIWKLTEG